jgi:hypothetical protein
MMTTSLAEMSQTEPGKFVAFMVKHMSAPVLHIALRVAPHVDLSRRIR